MLIHFLLFSSHNSKSSHRKRCFRKQGGDSKSNSNMFIPLNFVFCSHPESQHYTHVCTCQMIQDPLLKPTTTDSHLSVSFCACHSHTDHMHHAQKALGRLLPKSEQVFPPKLPDFTKCRKIAVPKSHNQPRKSFLGDSILSYTTRGKKKNNKKNKNKTQLYLALKL